MTDSQLKDDAISIFEANMPKEAAQIKDIRLLDNASTNTSFLVTNTKNKKFQVRIGNPKINRYNESIILKSLKDLGGFIYYNSKNGNGIKVWVDGVNPTVKTCHTPAFIGSFVKELKALQKTVTEDPIMHRDFYVFEKISDFNGLKNQLKKYREIITKYRKLPQVVSHNDLRPANLVWSNKKVKFIDFEWATLNNQYWDLCNFVREVEYPLTKLKTLIGKHFQNLDFDVAKEFLFACTFFAYQWTFFAEQTKDIVSYRKNTKRLMTEYYNMIKAKAL